MKTRPENAVFGVALAFIVTQPTLADGLNDPTAILERHNAAFAIGDVDAMYELGGDTFFIEDGKIATQTLTLKATPKP